METLTDSYKKYILDDSGVISLIIHMYWDFGGGFYEVSKNIIDSNASRISYHIFSSYIVGKGQ